MSERLRCGVIGAGARGWQHLNSLLHCPRAVPVAVAEPHLGRAKEAADRFRLTRSYTKPQDLLDQPDIDAVTVAVPNHLHAQVVLDALAARKHVLVEAPLALTAKEAAKVVETARKSRRVLMVGQTLRFNKHTQAARRILERGDLGDVYHAHAYWWRQAGIPRIGSWYTRRQLSGGGCLLDLGSRILDTALYLLGGWGVKSVSAHTSAHFGPRRQGEMDWGRSELDPKRVFDVEDTVVVMLRLDGGRTLLLEVGWAGHRPGDRPEYGIDLSGTNGSLSLYPARMHRPGADGQETIQLAGISTEAEDCIHHFAYCAVEGRRPLVTLDESLKLQRLLDAIYTSASAGKEVKLD
jgi:predicted dehydrogenase